MGKLGERFQRQDPHCRPAWDSTPCHLTKVTGTNTGLAASQSLSQHWGLSLTTTTAAAPLCWKIPAQCWDPASSDRARHPAGAEPCYLPEGDYAEKTARWGLCINRICSAG